MVAVAVAVVDTSCHLHRSVVEVSTDWLDTWRCFLRGPPNTHCSGMVAVAVGAWTAASQLETAEHTTFLRHLDTYYWVAALEHESAKQEVVFAAVV